MEAEDGVSERERGCFRFVVCDWRGVVGVLVKVMFSSGIIRFSSNLPLPFFAVSPPLMFVPPGLYFFAIHRTLVQTFYVIVEEFPHSHGK